MAMIDMLCAVSPLDGRYGSKVDELREVFSEYGLVKRRVAVECAWLAALCAHPGLPECPPLTADEAAANGEHSVRDLERPAELVGSVDALLFRQGQRRADVPPELNLQRLVHERRGVHLEREAARVERGVPLQDPVRKAEARGQERGRELVPRLAAQHRLGDAD